MDKIFFTSLGCDKNLVDSEQMTGLLSEQGYEFTDDETLADIAIVNTCCFIGDARQESINTIIGLGGLKVTGSLKALIVCGCLAQRYRDEIEKELPEVDAIVGTTAFDEIVSCVKEVMEGQGREGVVTHLESPDRFTYMGKHRSVRIGGHYAYLKIAEGCDKRCTYCIIPKVRGRYRSVPMEELLHEAGILAKNGVKELILVAQETTVYGVDIAGRKLLGQLLKELCAIEGFEWIRIMYAYPEEIDDGLIEVMASEPKIRHYLDIPIQSGSDAVLKRMGRRCGADDIVRMVERLREKIPDICLRTTLISGFPGESDEDHEATVELVKRLRFDRLGVFVYSPEEGTPAFDMEGQVDEAIAEKRRDEIMELQQEISLSKGEELVGSDMYVMVDGRDTEDGIYVCRSYRDAPDVDGYVFVTGEDREYMSGDLIRVRITGANEYDLTGERYEG